MNKRRAQNLQATDNKILSVNLAPSSTETEDIVQSLILVIQLLLRIEQRDRDVLLLVQLFHDNFEGTMPQARRRLKSKWHINKSGLNNRTTKVRTDATDRSSSCVLMMYDCRRTRRGIIRQNIHDESSTGCYARRCISE